MNWWFWNVWARITLALREPLVLDHEGHPIIPGWAAPHGQYLAYTSIEDAPRRVYVMIDGEDAEIMRAHWPMPA